MKSRDILGDLRTVSIDRVRGRAGTGRKIYPYLRDHTSSSNSCTLPDCHPGENSDIPGQPTILTDMDLLSRFGAFGPIAQGRVQRVSSAVQVHIGTEHGPCPDRHQTGVDNVAVGIDKDAFTRLHIKPVVHSDGSLYPWFILEESFIFLWVVLEGWERGFVLDKTGPQLVYVSRVVAQLLTYGSAVATMRV